MKYSFIAACTALVACIGLPLFAANDLAGTEWTLLAYNGSGTTAGTLSFDESMVYSKFCNNVSQGYSVSGSALYASGVGMSTMMYCEGLPMTLEYAFQLSETSPSPFVMTGGQLMITTSGNNIFLFTKVEPMICTMEYAPVCGVPMVDCSDSSKPCPMVMPQTYGNGCQLAAAKATKLYEGVCVTDESCIQQFDGCNTCTRTPGGERACTKMYCETPTTPYCMMTTDDEPMVGNDKDTHGCIGSAGYSWSQSQQACIRVWEHTGASTLEKAYDFAFNQGMTTMNSVQTFRAFDTITRQEAAKMFMMLKDKTVDAATYGALSSMLFSDAGQFDPTLKDYIYSSYVAGIMQGSKGAFMPQGSLTKGQAFAVLMRILDGKQTEPDTATRWMPYVQRAESLKWMTPIDTSDFNASITRGTLIEWAQTLSLAASVSN